MRGADTFTESLFTLRQLEDFIPAGHPLRAYPPLWFALLHDTGLNISGVALVEGVKEWLLHEYLTLHESCDQ